MDTKVEKYESNEFQVGGHKWKLILYPSGNPKSNGKGHVSLYMAIADTENLIDGWEVNVNFKLFVFDQKNNNYLTIQGYLIEDSCVFGAEVFVIGHSGKWESLSLVKDPPHASITFKLEKFSTLDNIFYTSNSINVGERDWRLKVFPKGESDEKGKSLTVFLELLNCERFPSNRTLYAKFKLRILDQLHNKYYEKTASNGWFNSSISRWGYRKFISLSELNEAENGYLKDDTIIIEAQILTVSIVKISF
ncbi:TRAF family protein [Trifolium repens]|nr:TRAF family protein [Trifolium repens]